MLGCWSRLKLGFVTLNHHQALSFHSSMQGLALRRSQRTGEGGGGLDPSWGDVLKMSNRPL